jgi:hypothetical protein
MSCAVVDDTFHCGDDKQGHHCHGVKREICLDEVDHCIPLSEDDAQAIAGV